MLGYLDKNKKHKRRKRSFGGAVFIPKSDKNTFVVHPMMDNQTRRDHMVDTVNHMLVGNEGVRPNKTEPRIPRMPNVRMPSINPPSIQQMPMGQSIQDGRAGSSNDGLNARWVSDRETQIEDAHRTSNDVPLHLTGRDVYNGAGRALTLGKNAKKLVANTGLFALDFAGRVAETAVDAGNMTMDVANAIAGFTRTRRSRYDDSDEDSPMAIQDAPREIQDAPSSSDESVRDMGKFTQTIDLTDDVVQID